MKEQKRRELLKNTFRLADGERCRVGGLENPVYAIVAPYSGGFFLIFWESLKRAKENNEPISDQSIRSVWGRNGWEYTDDKDRLD